MEHLTWYEWWAICGTTYIFLRAIAYFIDHSRRYNNWKYKRRFKKSNYALSAKDVVIKGE